MSAAREELSTTPTRKFPPVEAWYQVMHIIMTGINDTVRRSGSSNVDVSELAERRDDCGKMSNDNPSPLAYHEPLGSNHLAIGMTICKLPGAPARLLDAKNRSVRRMPPVAQLEAQFAVATACEYQRIECVGPSTPGEHILKVQYTYHCVTGS